MRRRILWKVDIDKSDARVYNDNTVWKKERQDDVSVFLYLYVYLGLSAFQTGINLPRIYDFGQSATTATA